MKVTLKTEIPGPLQFRLWAMMATAIGFYTLGIVSKWIIYFGACN